MAWTREMWEAMVTKGAKGSSTPWGRAPQSSGAGRNGLNQNLSLNPQRFINDRLSNLSQNTQDQATKALGMSNVSSMNDVNKIFEWVNDQSRKKVEEEQAPTDDPNAGGNGTGSGKNEPNVNYNPTSTVVEGENQESKEQTYDPNARRNDASNLNRWGGRADRFGMADLHSAYQSGYSYGDINNWLGTQNDNRDWVDHNRGGYNSNSAAYRALNENRQGKITSSYYNPNAVPHGGEGEKYFGHADLLGNRKAGFSDYQILSYLDNNLGKLRGNNAKGVAGGIYEELNSMRPKDPKNLLTGGSNLGNAGYADAVKPNRSEASSSAYSSFGTSQYNRDNFNNKKKSGVTVARGLTI